jgi:uncharacterized damage-inducible protein DinB
MRDKQLRNDLIELLKGGHAHASAERILRGISSEARNTRPSGMPHTIWELLEHMRLAQEDILRYTLDPNWVSPKFPEGYWPSDSKPSTESDWSNSLSNFLRDLGDVIKLVEDNRVDLTAEIPHGEGRTYLREILLVADHNSYHLGQIAQIRKGLGDWAE